MADIKKPDKDKDKKPEKPAKKMADPFVEIVQWGAVIFIVIFLFNGFVRMFTTTGLFSHGLSGLTPQGIMLSHTRPIASLENPIGARIISTSMSTDVYNSPGGKKIGSQPLSARGKILQGPVEINGEKYWYVDFDSGPDGWVKESDIAYLQSEPTPVEKVIIWLYGAFWYLKLFLILLSIILVVLITKTYLGLVEIRKKETALLYPTISKDEMPEINPKWQKILTQIDSQNENDWKLAIIEADIMLDDILSKLSLPGDTMGEKMKAVEKSDWSTIDNAWEAHKIRNGVAHEGSEFVLTQHEARRVISLYQSVFEEFQII